MTESIRLGDHCSKIGSGATPRGGKETYLVTGPFALIRSQNVWNTGFVKNGLAFISGDQARNLQNVEVFPKDVLLNITGDSAARACQVDDEILPARVNQHVCIIRPESPKLDPTFLRYWLVTASTQHLLLGLASAGATRNALTKAMVENLMLPAVPIAQQKAIAAVLGALDDKIALNRRMNETLEGLARAIFKSWFVDFDPVHAKAEGRDTDLAPGLAALFPDRFGDNGLPEGWEEKPFSELVEIIGGGTPKTSEPEYWHGDIPWFSVADTPSGSDTFVFQTEKNITPQGLSGSSARLVCRGTTIITARGTVGKLAIAGCDMAFNQSCYALRSLKDLHPFFTYLAAQYVVKQLKSMAHGSVFSTITRQTFENVNFPTSSVEMRDAFEKLSAPLFERISVSVQESQTLAALRDLLLPKLMSGEIRIRDAEKLAGEAGA